MQKFEFRPSTDPGSGSAGAAPSEVWVDIDISDADGRRWLSSESGLDEQVVERMLQPPSTTYWRRFGRGRHLEMRAAVPGRDPLEVSSVAFGIWLEPGRVITMRYGNAPAFDRAAKACAAGTGPASSWELVLFVLSSGMGRVEQDLHDLIEAIDDLEDEVLALAGDPPIQRVGELQKRLVYARRYRIPLANMLSFIATQPESNLAGGNRDEFDAIVTAVQQHQELLDLSIDRAAALQGQIRDQMADAMNTATYRFTWVATVFLPLSFLTGLLGINVAGIPGDHNPSAFWLVCVVLVVISVFWGIAVFYLNRPFKSGSNPRDR